MSLLRQLLRAAQALEGESWAAYEDCRSSRSAVWLRPLAQPTHGDGRKRPLLVVERAWRWGGRGDVCGAVIGVGCQRHQDPEPLWSGRLQGRGLASAQRALTEIARDLAAMVAWTDANPHLGAIYAHNYVELDLRSGESLAVRMHWRPGGLRLGGLCVTHIPRAPARCILPGLYMWSWEGDLAELQAVERGDRPYAPEPTP